MAAATAVVVLIVAKLFTMASLDFVCVSERVLWFANKDSGTGVDD